VLRDIQESQNAIAIAPNAPCLLVLKVKTMKKIEKHAKMVGQFEQTINDHVTEGKKAFPRDTSMQKVYQNDARDLRAVLALFRKKDIAGACARAWKMDSVPHDVIPQTIWRIMEKDQP